MGLCEEEYSSAYKLKLVSPDQWEEPNLRRVWKDLVNSSENLNVIYASPEWFDHLRAVRGDSRLAIMAAMDVHGALKGIIPLSFSRDALHYDVANRALYTSYINTAQILGSVPLLPKSADLHHRTYREILRLGNLDALHMDVVQPQDYCFKVTLENNEYLAYVPYGIRKWHILHLPESEEKYKRQMSSKTRSTLQRKARKLKEYGGGSLTVVRVETEESVENFLACATEISKKSWQHRLLGPRLNSPERAEIRSAAKEGLLRAYLLKAGEIPCAFVIGHQYNGVYHSNELAFDPEYARLSPGTVLFFLLIRDLCEYKRPSTLNFGVGHAEYKERFGNVARSDASVFLFRRTLANQAMVLSHRAFRSGVNLGRGLLRGRKEPV
jgi:CelD/BcsL family acetyltransferase involved in cellulose biosynthesis